MILNSPESPRFTNPDWIESAGIETTGQDLVGLRNPAQSIGNDILTAITTITPRIRYFSMLAWIIYLYDKSRLPNRYSDFLQYAARVESAIVLGTLLEDNDSTGLIGSVAARKIMQSNDQNIELKRLVDQLAVNQYAGPSMSLNIAHMNRPKPPFITPEIGLPLAEAFDRKVANTSFVKNLRKQPLLDQVDRNDLLEFGRAVNFATVDDEEREIFESTIFPVSEIRSSKGTENRIATYALILAIADRITGIPTPNDIFQVVINKRSDLPDFLDEVYNGWLCYLIRDSLAVIHETSLQVIIMELSKFKNLSRWCDSNKIVEAILDQEGEINKTLIRLGILKEAEGFRELRFNEFVKRLEDKLLDSAEYKGMVRWDGEINEVNIIDLAFENLLGAIALLPVVWVLTAKRIAQLNYDDSRFNKNRLSRGGYSRFGYKEIILPAVNEWQDYNPHLQQIINELILKTVDQHLSIAWTRWASNPVKDVAILDFDDTNLCFRKKFVASRTESRLYQAIGWCEQLGYIQNKGLTEKGRAILSYLNQNLLKFHTGKANESERIL